MLVIDATRLLRGCILLAITSWACHASPWTLDYTQTFWSAWLESSEGMCHATAWQAEEPAHQACYIQITERSLAPGDTILPQTDTAIYGTIYNSGPLSLSAALLFTDGELQYQKYITIDPGQVYAGVIGEVFGRWESPFYSGGGLQRSGWITFSYWTGDLYKNRYEEMVSPYTAVEAASFVYETPEPRFFGITGIALLLLCLVKK